MSRYAISQRTRLPAALAAVAIEGAVVLALVLGLAARLAAPSDSPPLEVTVPSRNMPSAPPPPAEPGGRPDDPALKAEPQPREAPRPDIPIPVPSQAAPVAGAGVASEAGAATAGSGTGGGGSGSGSGSGSGAGTGSGIKARWVAGAFSDRDYARTAEIGPPSGAVTIAFRVRSDGRVDRCRAVASSGGAELDAYVCGLYERRYRFAPARNPKGEAIDSELRTTVEWGPRRRG
ncbi:MAG: energy transducer TonB [Novosphingobium sp.]